MVLNTTRTRQLRRTGLSPIARARRRAARALPALLALVGLGASGASVPAETPAASSSASDTAGGTSEPQPAAASLVSELSAVEPGASFHVALRISLDQHWHVYWENPGDSGLPPAIDWTLPDGVEIGEIRWPVPSRIQVPPLTSFGLEGDVILPLEVRVPETLEPGTDLTLEAVASWLVCRVACLPGDARLSLTLPIAERSRTDDQWAPTIRAVLGAEPVTPVRWRVRATVEDEVVVLLVDGPAGHDAPSTATFFPRSDTLIEHASAQTWSRTPAGWMLRVSRSRLSLAAPERVSGLLVADVPWALEAQTTTALTFDVPVEPLDAADLIEVSRLSVSGTSDATGVDGVTGVQGADRDGTGASVGLVRVLAFAFLGGLILNLMPCVLPVLSVKVLGLIQGAEAHRRSRLRHGALFSGGVLVAFWALAAVMALLEASGERLGWGFQLQSAPFVMVLAAVFFLLGLNLLGVFEIGTSFTRASTTLDARGDGVGTFASGIMTTVVATPCTAPFMGSALGYTLTAPGIVSFLVFTMLGLGMALPYVALVAMPGWLRLVPRPGPWMDVLRGILGFVLFGTVVWLAWVLSLQAGAEGVLILAATLVLLGLGAWILRLTEGRFATRQRVAHAGTTLLVVGVVATAAFSARALEPPAALTGDGGAGGGIAWRAFDAETLGAARAGTPTFIDFTAAWCLSCQVNERVALETDAVRRRFAELGVVPVKADWTSRDPVITEALASFDRHSVPLYVLFGSDPGSEPIVLPELLTSDIVLDALDRVDPTHPKGR